MACFFGFGSLVNTETHKYVAVAPASVDGWSRAWINNDYYDHAFLSVMPDQANSIQGLMAEVPNDDWAELDLREAGYKRLMLTAGDWSAEPSARFVAGPRGVALDDVQMYQHATGEPASAKSILWSYLETVLFGYYQWFGAPGVAAFVDSTIAWTTILDDRQSPRYPRYVPAVDEAASVVLPVVEALYRKMQA